MAARKKHSEAPKLENIHAVIGSDEARVKEASLELTKKHLPPGASDFSLETLDGRAENADHAARICNQVIEALQTLPFFGTGKVVWLRGANFLVDTVTGGAGTTLEAVDRMLQVIEGGLPADVHFILSAGAVDKRRTFFLRLEKIAHVQIFDLPDPGQRGWEAQVETMILDRAAKAGLTFDPDALELFALLAGERTQNILSELEKIDLFLGTAQRVVTVDIVRELVPLTRAGVVFEVGNAIGRREARRALELLDRLLDQEDKPMTILLAAIVPKMRNLVLGREIAERLRWPPGASDYRRFQAALENLPPEETAHLPRKKDGALNAYPLFLAAQESERFSVSELRAGLQACLKANHRLVTTSLDPHVVLSQLIVELTATKLGRGAA
ncbi:MAG: DNA polymerase III subunit delta [Verrucomicrobiales bacterium]